MSVAGAGRCFESGPRPVAASTGSVVDCERFWWVEIWFVVVFRNSFVGQALKKLLSVDGQPLGQTANQVYFYKEIAPGEHVISTESEFGDNSVTFHAEGGKNYFARQYIRMGVRRRGWH